jgi:hypothetical protein
MLALMTTQPDWAGRGPSGPIFPTELERYTSQIAPRARPSSSSSNNGPDRTVGPDSRGVTLVGNHV